MTAIDKLRGISRMFDTWHVESEDEDGTIEIRYFSNYQIDPDCLGSRIRELLDEIEVEISEHYMPLPLDADGVPIRAGDLIEFGRKGERIEVTHIGWTKHGDPTIAYRRPNGTLDCSCIGIECRHVKPRTIEAVLEDYRRELVETWAHTLDDEMTDAEDEITARYAEEIRGMK